ncbi:hypothetical protein LCL97_07925 [Seohaeicola saemankumensis]|nr:hypothetical protein [Seohaeicola saemankumensis]MCA0870747.1 hypothetical protein [Seohaeicola saemankumensis]
MFRRYERSGLLVMALPLYAGPLLAGWTRAPLALPAALAAMFFMAQLLAGKAEARGSLAMPAYLGLLAATQVVVVAVVYALGLILALLLGRLPAPQWLPLLMTGFGAVLLVKRYGGGLRQDQMSALLDDAIAAIEDAAPFDTAGDDSRTATDPAVNVAVQDAVVALWNLPADAPVGALDQIVQQLEEQTGAQGYLGLLAEIDEGFPQIDRAMLRYLAAPPVRAALVASGDIRVALDILAEAAHPAVMGELRLLLFTLLDDNVPAAALPDPELLRATPALAELADPVTRAAAGPR